MCKECKCKTTTNFPEVKTLPKMVSTPVTYTPLTSKQKKVLSMLEIIDRVKSNKVRSFLIVQLVDKYVELSSSDKEICEILNKASKKSKSLKKAFGISEKNSEEGTYSEKWWDEYQAFWIGRNTKKDLVSYLDSIKEVWSIVSVPKNK